jgi:hypothetical protein
LEFIPDSRNYDLFAPAPSTPFHDRTVPVIARDGRVAVAALRTHIGEAVSAPEGSMDYLIEARKFIQRSREAKTPEVILQDLSMAEWCLSQAIAERDGVETKEEAPKKSH